MIVGATNPPRGLGVLPLSYRRALAARPRQSSGAVVLRLLGLSRRASSVVPRLLGRGGVGVGGLGLEVGEQLQLQAVGRSPRLPALMEKRPDRSARGGLGGWKMGNFTKCHHPDSNRSYCLQGPKFYQLSWTGLLR